MKYKSLEEYSYKHSTLNTKSKKRKKKKEVNDKIDFLTIAINVSSNTYSTCIKTLSVMFLKAVESETLTHC